MLTDMITLSDNNACDILMRQLGGPEAITSELHNLGVKDIQITCNETEMAADWVKQYTNWSRPSTQVELLRLLYQNKLLEPDETTLLTGLMENTFVAPHRIRGLLPIGTTIAHRSGTSGTNDDGLSPATNDIGVITLPGGRHLAVAIFLTDSYADDEDRDKVIAEIAKAAYRYALD
jgi:beta-lactamase class A